MSKTLGSHISFSNDGDIAILTIPIGPFGDKFIFRKLQNDLEPVNILAHFRFASHEIEFGKISDMIPLEKLENRELCSRTMCSMFNFGQLVIDYVGYSEKGFKHVFAVIIDLKELSGKYAIEFFPHEENLSYFLLTERTSLV